MRAKQWAIRHPLNPDKVLEDFGTFESMRVKYGTEAEITPQLTAAELVMTLSEAQRLAVLAELQKLK